ncbi:MFS transporter [Methanoregula sp. PtaB.Bin085]|uniref:MFS transporter n=1 Tax=Methanoregula sp. PtaB.Bin085 TaxID=1811680 RepID=UPI0009C70F49|nr:MFS transporter [Methanoregula sp. PtaB.Bin085]OPX61934.1 MAG: putative transporter [Methanoregula sp. PtaB.Bin085]
MKTTARTIRFHPRTSTPSFDETLQTISHQSAGIWRYLSAILIFSDYQYNPTMDNTVDIRREGFTLLILSISLAMFMSSLDGTIVNIALPAISESFRISATDVSWVATSYLLVLVGCVLVFGKISDMIGFKRVFLAGFTIFTLGSLSCGVLPEIFGGFYALIASRMFQAIGGAMIAAIAPAMITAYIPVDLKGKAMGIIMIFAALGTALGPTIGGVLTQYLSWHWIFIINVPVGIVAVLLGAKVIPPATPAAASAPFDRSGAILAFAGLASLVFVVSEGETLGWTSPVILGLALIAAGSFAGFIRHELSAPDPLLDLNLFWNGNFLLANLLLFFVFFSFSGINYLLPFYLKYIGNYDTSTAGLILTSLSFAMMAAGYLSGQLFNRLGPRRLCILAGIPLIIGYFMMTRLHIDTSTLYIVTSLLLIGFGLGLVVTPVTTMIMMAVPRSRSGMISSLTTLLRTAPLSIGIATYNLIFIQGILAIAKNHDVTRSSPMDIQLHVLSAGFDLAFLLSLALGIIILAIAVITREEVHPDYADEYTEILRTR